MDSKGVGQLWWDTSEKRASQAYTLFYSLRKNSATDRFGNIAIGGILETAVGYEYIHYGQEIPSVLVYEGMSLADVKTAVETVVRLTCNLGATL